SQHQNGIKWENRKISDAWDHFEQLADETTGEPKVICKHCSKLLTHPNVKRSGTSTLSRHLKADSCCKDQMTQDLPQKPTNEVFNQSLWEELLLNLITATGVSFSMVESESFKELIQCLRPDGPELDIPSAEMLRRLIDVKIQERQQSILAQLPEGKRLSIALDCWTSPHSQKFMAITGYFIDNDWNYHEVSLGFEPLIDWYTGDPLSETKLSEIAIQILTEHGIADRVLSITTNNASNDNALMAGVQDAMLSQGLRDASIFRVPYIVDVIELSLNELLGELKAVPENEAVEREWSDERTQSLLLRCSTRKHRITDTLDKVRGLAIFVNSCGHCMEEFIALQPNGRKLLPIQDVRSRKNSTFLMLNRARNLRPIFDQYCRTHPQFELGQEEWRQVDYLLSLTKRFFEISNILSKTRDVLVPHVLSIYNVLFRHLDDAEIKLKRKAVPWKKRMLRALGAARNKLEKYYVAADTESYGTLYGIATILCPSKKLEYFDDPNWRGGGIDRKKHFRNMLQEEYTRYQQLFPEIETGKGLSPLDLLLYNDRMRTTVDFEPVFEIREYLNGGLNLGNPRVFWKESEKHYPILAQMARNTLPIPASGAGVERLLNCARHICHYRRERKGPRKIKRLMLYMFSSKFELDEGHFNMLEEYISDGEAAMIDQLRNPLPEIDDLDPISDDEEAGWQEEDAASDSQDDQETKRKLRATQHGKIGLKREGVVV
ncbi:uncharacterized protein N7515_007040, partial [Penicillium bovifimosum]